jgi:hypothetical protein
MLSIRNGVIYLTSRLKSGYFIVKFPPNSDAELIASKLKTKQETLKIIEEDSKNDKQTKTKST